MIENAFTPPGDNDPWCDTVEQFLKSPKFLQFLSIYNHHTAGTRANGVEVTPQDVLIHRNLRNAMRAFFRTRLRFDLCGAEQATTVSMMSQMVDAVMKVLDGRNQQLRKGTIAAGSTEDTDLLQQKLRY